MQKSPHRQFPDALEKWASLLIIRGQVGGTREVGQVPQLDQFWFLVTYYQKTGVPQISVNI